MMDRFGVELALEHVNKAYEQYREAMRQFQIEMNRAMARLIHEGIANGMSIEQFAKASGMTKSHVRRLMRNNGLDPKNGKRFLAHAAAEALKTNADLMGVEPSQIDLMSPLAYLPMGSELRSQLESEAVKGVKDLDVGLDEELDEDGRSEKGRYLRDHWARPDHPTAYVICARSHTPGNICIQPDGHE